MDKEQKNELYCEYTGILYTNPNGAPEDEVALICFPGGTGIMMEWERPISKLPLFLRFHWASQTCSIWSSYFDLLAGRITDLITYSA